LLQYDYFSAVATSMVVATSSAEAASKSAVESSAATTAVVVVVVIVSTAEASSKSATKSATIVVMVVMVAATSAAASSMNVNYFLDDFVMATVVMWFRDVNSYMYTVRNKIMKNVRPDVPSDLLFFAESGRTVGEHSP
jgi:hypothetical protein